MSGHGGAIASADSLGNGLLLLLARLQLFVVKIKSRFGINQAFGANNAVLIEQKRERGHAHFIGVEKVALRRIGDDRAGSRRYRTRT